MHSQPKYPFVQGNLPDRRYCQIFMCVNLHGHHINLVKSHLTTIDANIYDSKGIFGQPFALLTPFMYQMVSREGVQFELFTKPPRTRENPNNNRDIWRDMVSAYHGRL